MTPRLLLDRILQTVGISRVGRYRGLRGKGQQWEQLAARRLEAEGYTIRELNFRGRAGEIDLIAEDKGVLCFVEVKGRSGPGFGPAAEAVTLEKQRRIFRCAQEYLQRRHLGAPRCRFDVVTIAEDGGRADVVVLRNAFEEPPPAPRR